MAWGFERYNARNYTQYAPSSCMPGISLVPVLGKLIMMRLVLATLLKATKRSDLQILANADILAFLPYSKMYLSKEKGGGADTWNLPPTSWVPL